MNREISEELLNAFADNELDGAEKAEVLECIAADEGLRAKVCETWHLKELVRSAHPLGDKHGPRKKSDRWRLLGLPLAACLLLAIGASSGWLAHDQADEFRVSGADLRAIQANGGRVVLHLVSGDPAEIDKALRKAKQLAEVRDLEGGVIEVEVVANGPGIRMLQDGASRLASRVVSMRAEHRNIRLVACNETLNRLRERGVDITLLPEVDVVPSAIKEIATRIDQGWRYLQV
ncbi:MAG: DsrE family protein [Gammaproteobacteria bacterium]|nr:DsrE family protein [Gammaproteobacteria bacterium]MBU1415791.1 DsrE family protein [Gammaproteobacteria bacterium]